MNNSSWRRTTVPRRCKTGKPWTAERSFRDYFNSYLRSCEVWTSHNCSMADVLRMSNNSFNRNGYL